MKVEYVGPFAEAAVSVMKMVLGTTPERGQLSARPQIFTTQQINIVCGITGMVEGLVIYGMSMVTADRIASKMIGAPVVTFDGLAASAIAELGNMISGNSLALLASKGFNCDITPPTIVRGGSVDGAPSLGWGAATSDFFAITASDAIDALAALAETSQRLWHYRLYDTVSDPDGMLRRWLDDHMTLLSESPVSGRDFGLVQLFAPLRPPDQSALSALVCFGEQICLLGDTQNATVSAGSPLYLPLRWRADGLGQGFAGAVVAGDLVVTAGENAAGTEVIALDLDGRPRWRAVQSRERWRVPKGKQDWAQPHGGARATPTLADGRVYHLDALGRLAAFRAEDGVEVWHRDLVREFVDAKRPNTRYHTRENGWPDHERFRAAFPFATGAIALDTPWEALSETDAQGKRLFLNACISCHDRAVVGDEGPAWSARPVSYPRAGFVFEPDGSPPVDALSGASVYARHDVAPAVERHPPRAVLGKQLFEANCAFCHGADGTGKNWIGRFMEPPARDLTTLTAASMPRERLVATIRDGLEGRSMPAWRDVMTPAQIDAVADYVSRAFMQPARVDRPAAKPGAG